MIGRRMFVSTRRDHAVAISQTRVARRAINVVTLTATRERLLIDWDFGGHIVAGICADLSSAEILMFMKLTAGDRALNRRACGAQVGVEVAHRIGLEARLVVHIVAAACENAYQASDHGGVQTHPTKTA